MTGQRAHAWLALAMLLVMLPLLPQSVAPLNDLYDHIGRYHIMASIDRSGDLQRHWMLQPAWIGNLGVDLLVVPLARWIGVEPATRVVVTLLPALFVGGLALVMRARGQVLSPLTGFAAALAYHQAFQLGFVNYALATALAFAALALWIRWAERPALRSITFAGIGLLLWTTHSSGWGIFGLMAWASDVAMRRERGTGWTPACLSAALACVPLLLPLAVMATGPATDVGEVAWNFTVKAAWIASLVRDRWRWFDVAGAIVLVGLAWTALRRPDWRFDPVIGAAGAILLVAFALLPRIALNGAYVDMRVLAPAVALLLVAVRIDSSRQAARLFGWGMAFLAVRMAATAASFVLLGQARDETAMAIAAMPRGTTVLTLVDEPCSSAWSSDRLGHVAGLAIARRDVFTNSQWAIAGQQWIRPRYPESLAYRTDPSQLVYPKACEYRTTDLGEALRTFDRHIYRHVWLIGFDRIAVPGDLVPVFRNRRSTLYAVRPAERPRTLAGTPFPPLKAADAGGQAQLVADAVVRRVDGGAGGDPALVARHSADGRPARPYGALSRPAAMGHRTGAMVPRLV